MTVVEKMKIEMIKNKIPIVTASSFYSNSSNTSILKTLYINLQKLIRVII